MRDIRNLRLALLCLVLAGWTTTLLLAAILGLKVDYPGVISAFGYAGISGLLLICYANYRRIGWLVAPSEVFLGCTAMAMPVVLSTYIAMRLNQPLVDGELEAIDNLFFDWRAFITFVDARPLLARILGLAYESFLLQLLVLPLALSLSGATERAYRMVILFGVIGFASSIVAIWFPAIGTFPRYLSASDHLANINTHFGYHFLNEFNAVRNDPNFVFAPDKLAGILTFPSVHAAVAVLCAWAAWGNKVLRLPFLVLNLLMMVSAVSHANHYMIDVLAGGVLALACITALQIAIPARSAGGAAVLRPAQDGSVAVIHDVG